MKLKWGISQKFVYSSILPLIRQASLSEITVNLPTNLYSLFEQDLNLGGIIFHKTEDPNLSNEITFSNGIESIQFID